MWLMMWFAMAAVREVRVDRVVVRVVRVVAWWR